MIVQCSHPLYLVASEDSVIADLKWLGILWDEGPDDPKAPYGPYRQSERSEIYKRVAEKLINEGHAYPCFCTMDELDAMKAKQEADGVPPRYDGTWRDADPSLVQKKLDEGAEYTIRFKVPPGARIVIEDAVRGTVSWDADATIGDFILLRSSGVPVYNFCVAVDDALMGVTTVIRAEEHLTNTVRQCLILDALGAPRPRYAHCSLILGEDKQKLSKRHGATSCNQFRIDGFLPDAMINYLALLGWNDGTDNEIFTREELIEAFDVNRVVKSPSIFDMAKLKWVNQQHMKMKTVEQLVTLVYDQLNYLNLFNENANEQSKKDFAYAATYLSKQMMETTRDGATNAKKVLSFALPATFDELIDKEAKDMVSEGSFYDISQRIINDYENGRFPQPDPSDPLAAFRDSDESKLRDAPSVSFPDAYKTYMKHLAKDFNLKGKQLFHPVRLALTGEMSGQDVTKQLALVVMACQENGAVNIKNADVVSLNERMERLKSFCATIPSELRVFKKTEQAQVEDRKKSAKEVPVKVTEISEIPSNSLASNESSTDIIDSYQGHPITALDIRVGRILKVWEHTEADKLYCEEIDVGESQPRMIASGLRPYMKMDDMVGRLVCVLCNLKERKLVGFPSHGMVLCASNKDHTEVKFVSPPVDAKVGERVTVPGFNFSEESGKPYTENVMGKKKVFEDLAPFLVTSKYGIPEFLGRPFVTSAGVCTSPIADGSVS
jgi:glutamyl-tRNA synthetase